MSWFDTLNVSGSAMAAGNAQMRIISENMAHANAVSTSEDQAYRAKVPVFEAMYDDASRLSGVEVSDVETSQAAVRKEYSPNHPQADADGFIYRSNASTVESMINMMMSSEFYQANLEMANTAKQMALKTIKMGNS